MNALSKLQIFKLQLNQPNNILSSSLLHSRDNSSTTMSNNSTGHPTYKTNDHTSIMIPRYINPVLEKSHPPPRMQMTTSSRDRDSNCGNTLSGMANPPYMVVAQQPQSTMHHVQRVNPNGEQTGINVFGCRDEKRNWSSSLFSCFDDWSSCE